MDGIPSSKCWATTRWLLAQFDRLLHRVRFHYGHPDIFDRIFHVTRGGVSKASKTINLSEDVFAGTGEGLLIIPVAQKYAMLCYVMLCYVMLCARNAVASLDGGVSCCPPRI